MKINSKENFISESKTDAIDEETFQERFLNSKIESFDDIFTEMAESEKENGIYIDDIKLLEKKIFEFFQKKAKLKIYEEQPTNKDLRLKSSEDETRVSTQPYEDLFDKFQENEEDKFYLKNSIDGQESLDYPTCKKDLEENFFFYSSKVNYFYLL